MGLNHFSPNLQSSPTPDQGQLTLVGLTQPKKTRHGFPGWAAGTSNGLGLKLWVVLGFLSGDRVAKYDPYLRYMINLPVLATPGPCTEIKTTRI